MALAASLRDEAGTIREVKSMRGRERDRYRDTDIKTAT